MSNIHEIAKSLRLVGLTEVDDAAALLEEQDARIAELEARAGEAVAYANARHLAEKMASVPAFRERTEYYDVPLYLHPPTGDAAGKDSVDAALYTMDQMREYADNFHLSRMKVLVAEKEAYERHAPTEPTLDQIRKIEDDFGIVWFVPDDSETFAWRTTNTDERDKFVRALAAAKPVSVDAYVMPERSVVTAPMIDACALMIKGICMTHPQDAWTAEIKERICYMLKTPPTESTGASMPERKTVEVTDEMVEAAYGAYLSPPADRARRDALRSVLDLATPASDSATPNETGEAKPVTFTPCTCFEDTARKYCAKSRVCSRVEAQGSTGGPNA